MAGSHLVTRSCVGCGQKRPQEQLVRFVRSLRGSVVESAGEIRLGRGAYLCVDTKERCLIKAIQKRAFERNLPSH
jgi:predicted RNA-binding protein YlxR (DUF448 family)